MKNIIVVDDQDHALKQIIYEFPGINKNDIAFRHFDTMAAFRKEPINNIFVLFLDFFLTKDKDYGTSLIPEIKCEHLICFSSMKEMSDHMWRQAKEQGTDRIHNVYSIQKIKGEISNQELRRVLSRILG